MGKSDLPKVAAYGGNEPYIFISYSHKDADTVVGAIKTMQELGYRVWFDLGIEVGTEWSNNIASHLRDCTAFVAFISSNSVVSENCLDEIAYAKSHKKPSLMIFLEEDVVLPEGTEMQTARFQRMFFNRQDSLESFAANINGAPILASCQSAVRNVPIEADVTPSPKADYDKKTEKTSSDSVSISKKTVMIGAAAAVVIIVLIIALALSLGGGKENVVPPETDDPQINTDAVQTPDTTQAPNTPDSEDNADVPVTMSDSLLDYTFKLGGEVYKLPFAFTELTENGWTITSSGYSSDSLVGGMAKENFVMVKDGRRISVGVYNQSGNAMPISECDVGEISVEADDKTDFEIAKGIIPGSTVDEIIAAFGTPGERETYDDYERLKYGETDYGVDGVTIYCYTNAEMSGYSSIEMKQYIITNTSATETNETVPEYLSKYVAPTELGDNVISGNVKIGGDLYHIPAPVQQFLDNGWTISSGPGAVVSGGDETIGLSRDGVKIDVSIANGATYQTTPQNCAVYGVTIYRDDSVDIELPGGAKVGLAKSELSLPDTFDVSESTYSILYSYYEYEPRDLTIYVSVDTEDEVVDYIKVRSYSWGTATE